MHATSTAFELYLSDLSPFALCAPSFLLRLWVGKVFRIANHLNLLTTTSNFKTYKIFFVTFLRFFPSLGQYLPIYCIGRRETNIQRSSYFIPLPRRMPILHISHQLLQPFVTIQSFNKIVPNKNSAFCKKTVSFLTFFFANYYFQIDRKSLNLHPTPILSTQLGKTNLLNTIIQLPP